MKVHKLFSSNAKPVLQKPAYIKPKHRTYRQLLALDKPKRKVQVQSDDQNDDFLNKILKEQNKKERKKSSGKSNKKKNKPTSPTKHQKQKQNQNSQNIKTKINLIDLVNNQKLNQEQKNKSQLLKNNNKLHKHKQESSVEIIQQEKQTLAVNQIQTIPNQKQNQNKPQPSSKSKSKVTFKYSQNFKKSASQKDKIHKNQIYIDQTSTQKYRLLQQENKVIKNNFFSKLKIKNMQATTLLRARTHANLIPNNNKDQNLLLTKIEQKQKQIDDQFNNKSIFKSLGNMNPEDKKGNNNSNKQIQHHIINRFSSMERQMSHENQTGRLSAGQKYRNVVLKLAMMEIDRIQKSLKPKKRDFNSQRLFKNQYQEKLFLKSLQSAK